MKDSIRIFQRDFRRLRKNPVAVIVMIGICILPSLYAWFNVAANYDPYGHTENIKVAVANQDTGASSRQTENINVGKLLEENLKKNHDLGWEFVEEEKAVEGVRSGKYYAAIVIPEDFSRCFFSVLTDSAKRPQILYYLNEKKNAVAPKITDTGTETVQKEINRTFSQMTAETLTKLLHSETLQFSEDSQKNDQKFLSALGEIQENLKQYEEAVEDFENAAEENGRLLDDTKEELETVKEQLKQAPDALEEVSGILKDSRQAGADISYTLFQSLSEGESLFSDIDSQVSGDLTSIENRVQSLNGRLDETEESLQEILSFNGEILEALQQFSQDFSLTIAEEVLESLQGENQRHQEIAEQIKAGNDSIADAAAEASKAREDLRAAIKEGKKGLRTYRETYETEIQPELAGTLDAMVSLNGEISQSLRSLPSEADQTEIMAEQLEQSICDASDALEHTREGVQRIRKKLQQTEKEIQVWGNSQILEELLAVTGEQGQDIAAFMKSPVEIETKSLYAVENYGSALAPFYTNLAVWVGGMILIAILKLEVDRDKSLPKFSSQSAYLGRWFLFAVLGMAQGLIVCLGDLYLLRIQCAAPGIFIASGLLCSLVYVSLIYALSVTFKHIGKALSVILVILQIPGSAGTYPIEMTPQFFQNLHPFLPFTYGVNMMREAIAGVYAPNLERDVFFLAVFLPVSFLIGMGIRPHLLSVNAFFDTKLKETDFMLYEEYREPKEEKALRDLKFEQSYPGRVRRGFLAVLALPLLFLIFMLGLESKLLFLVLWIASIAGTAGYLIYLEYRHEKIKRRKEERAKEENV